MPETNSPSVWGRSMRRTTSMLLSLGLLIQPGCMCGCSSSQHTACHVEGCQQPVCSQIADLNPPFPAAVELNEDNITPAQGVAPG